MAQRTNSFHYPSLIGEAGLWPNVPVIFCKNVSNLFSMSCKNYQVLQATERLHISLAH
jgi:hypothetical protein